MRKIISICVILCVLCVLCACESCSEVQEENTNGMSMFVKVESTHPWDVVYHKDTKVMYAVSRGSYNQGTFTLLVNEDGTPMLWEGGAE